MFLMIARLTANRAMVSDSLAGAESGDRLPKREDGEEITEVGGAADEPAEPAGDDDGS